MREFLLVFHLLVTLVLIGVILIQRGEDAGAGGGSGGLPGARSGKNPLTRVTAILAAIFFADCLGMAILIRKDSQIGTEPIGKSESAPKPSGALPVVAAKQAVGAVGSNNDQSHSAQRSSADDSGRTSGAKSAPVSSASPAVASKPVVMTDSKKKPLKSSSKTNAKAKKKSKDRVKKSA